MDEGIDQKIREGKLKFDAIKDDVREEVNKQKGKVEDIIKDGTPELQKHVQRLTDSVSLVVAMKANFTMGPLLCIKLYTGLCIVHKAKKTSTIVQFRAFSPSQVSQQIEPKRIQEDVDVYMDKIEKADKEKYFDYMW